MEHVVGADVVAKNIIVFQKGFVRAVNRGMENVRAILDARITRNISLTDHSLSDLARLGHPYARGVGVKLHNPAYQVHTQSGRMLSAKVSGVDDADIIGGKLKASAWAGIGAGVPYAVHVIYGTSKMIPRDFLRGSLGEVRGQIIGTLSIPLKNAVINFDGEKVKL